MSKNSIEGTRNLDNLKHVLKVMRTTVFFFFFSIMLSLAAVSHSQEIKLSRDLKSYTIAEACKLIEKETGFVFVFADNSEDAISKKINVHTDSKSIHEILDSILHETELSYKIIDRQVVIFKEKTTDGRKESNKVLEVKSQQKKIIKGKVVDDKGEAVIGANVLEKGTHNGTITDADGNFSINVSEGATIIFSYIGYLEQNVIVKDKSVINITLKEDTKALEELVVTGYQIIDKRSLTSAITSLNAEDILVPGMTSIDVALEGRIPDLMLMANSGEVGSTPRIRVRGTSTLLGNREPLWVLDGFIMTDPVDVTNEQLNDPDYINIVGNAIAGINPQDIERIDVLKDASATALYGTRAANGVVVVTTKKGAIGTPRISLNHTSKITQRPRYTDNNINLMNSYERMEFGKNLADLHYQFPSRMPMVGYEGALHRFYKGITNFQEFTDEVRWYESVNTDWFSILTRDTYSTDNTISISGGSGDLRYYGSIGYNPETGVTIGTNTERYTSRANLNFTLFQKLKTTFSVYGNVQKKNHLSSDIDAMDYAYNTTRTLPFVNDDGTLYYYDKVAYNGMNQPSKMFRYNIMNEIQNSYNLYDGNSIGTNLDLRYTIKQGLEVSLSGSYTNNTTSREQWWGEKSHYVARLRNVEMGDIPHTGESGNSILPYGGVLRTSNARQESYTLRSQIEYRKPFGEDKRQMITAMGGFEMNGRTYIEISDENRGYVKERGLQFIDQIDLDDFPHYKSWINKNHRNIRYDITRQLSGYASLSYSYKSYFTINTNARFDASNKFGSRSNEKILPVWSISGMVNLKDVLFKDITFVSDWRIRTSLGLQGNMLEDQSPNLVIRQGTIEPQYNENVSWISRYPNPNLLWEQTSQFNLSSDWSFFNHRLNLSGTFYTKKTKDAFTTVKISSVNGVNGNSYVMNGGNLENIGYSLSVGGTPVRTKDFNWRISTFFGGNFNKTKTSNVDTYQMDHYLNGTALVNNMPVSTFYSYKFIGLNPLNGSPVFDDYNDRRHLLENKSLEEVMMMVTTSSGQREPIFNGSISNTVTYKRFSVSANITYSLGAKMRLFAMYDPILSGVSAENNIRKEFLNRWMNPGDEMFTNIPSIMSPAHPEYFNYNPHFSNIPSNLSNIPKFANNLWSMYDRSDIRVVSANYLKLSSLSLRYSFAPSMLRGTPFSNAQVSFNTINLFTISAKELRGQDPTQAGFAKPNLSIRPTYTFQFNVSF